MPPISSRWSFDPSNFAWSEEAQIACDLIFDLDEDHWFGLIQFGTWWVLPFARTLSDQVIGLRMMPGVPLSESPVVRLAEHEIETLASKPAFMIPQLLFPGSVLKGEYWDKSRDLPDSVWDEIDALHTALGGVDHLAAIKSILNDAKFRDACVIGLAEPARFAKALPEILMRLDSTPQTIRYREYSRVAFTTHEAPLPLPDVGCWRAAAAAVAFISNVPEDAGKPSPLAIEAAWEVSNQPPALDSFQAHGPSLNPRPIGKSQERLSRDVATLLVASEGEVPPAWKTDPLWPAITALASSPDEYRGLAHLDAAQALIKVGRPEAAFTAITAAAYWLYVRTQEPFPEYLRAAQMIAQDSGWEEIYEAIVRIATTVRGHA